MVDLNLQSRIDEQLSKKLEVSKIDLMEHCEQLVRDANDNVNSLRDDLMIRM